MASLRSCCRIHGGRILSSHPRVILRQQGVASLSLPLKTPACPVQHIISQASLAPSIWPSLRSLSTQTQGEDDATHTGDSHHEPPNPVSHGQDMFAALNPQQSQYVFVEHGAAYERALQGLHGQTLHKSRHIGKGRDDEPFDPFVHDEELEQRLLQEEAAEEAAAQKQAALEQGEAVEEEQAEEEEEKEEGAEEEDSGEEDDNVDLLSKKGELTKEELACIMYNSDGSIRRKASQTAILKAGAPAGGIFAIVALAGRQHKVTTDDLMIVSRLDVEKFKVGSVHALKDVLMVGTTHFTLVGLPYVPNAAVHVMVEEITKDKKVIIFKKRRRKHSQRKNGFRRDVTMLRILDITMPEEYEGLDHRPRIEPELLPPRPDPRLRKRGKHYQNDEEDEDEEDYEEEEEGDSSSAA